MKNQILVAVLWLAAVLVFTVAGFAIGYDLGRDEGYHPTLNPRPDVKRVPTN